MHDPNRTPDLQNTLNRLRRQSLARPAAEAEITLHKAGKPAGSKRKAGARLGNARPRMVVAIPSANRPGILPDTVRAIALQDRLPDLLILSLAALEDIGDLAPEHLPFPVEIVIGQKGATRQRNGALDLLRLNDIVLFLDDDFLMASDYLSRTVEIFQSHPEVVLATGTVLADGVGGPGLNQADGARILAERSATLARDTLAPTYSGYGCNMALRARPVFENDLEFDEALPLYSWLEDVDFSRRLAPHGKLVKSGRMRGVHLGTKTGRTPGVFLGYSQIVNPLYLLKKGSISRRHAYEMMARNTVSNLVHSLRPPRWADFRGRLRGNVIAVADLMRGRASPDRILALKP